MKRLAKILLMSAMLLPFGAMAQERDTTELPHFLTPKEREMMRFYTPPVSADGITSVPTSPMRTAAEWEACKGVLITWRSFPTILRQIVIAAQKEGKVYIVANANDTTNIKNTIVQGGGTLQNLVFIVAPSNSIWCRDYGPWSVYSNGVDTLYFIDWIYNRPRPNDDLVPVAMANQLNIPLFQMTTPPNDLVHTGGNFMTDGFGTGFSSHLVLDENPTKTEAQIDTLMHRFMGIRRYIKMPNLPYDLIHHIDMHMKLLDEETLLVGEYPQGVSDGPQIEANLQYVLNNFQTCYNRPYRVVRIPMPPDQFGRYPNQGGYYRTYTNSLIINKTVIVPTYEERYDTTALRIYREAMPGYTIVGVNCNQIIPQSGAIHCITKEIADDEPIVIAHKRLLDSPDSASHEVLAKITSRSGIARAEVFWTTDTAQGFQSVRMQAIGADSFRAEIALPSARTHTAQTIFYYIAATTNRNKRLTKPLTAEQGGAWKFTIQPSLAAPQPSNEPKAFMLAQNYPNPFNPTTIITYTLPSASAVRLELFDVLGRKIATLLDTKQASGTHTYLFNVAPRTLSSGVYFYRLEANAISGERFVQTKKMMLLK
ncbi:MAG: agmatine deiminase family protein [Chloroherpetonaceae bacterium]